MHGSQWHSLNLVNNGKTANKKQKYRCKEGGQAFITNSRYQGCRPFIRALILNLTLNSSGIRDLARVLQISTNTVQQRLRDEARNLPAVRVPTHPKTVALDEFWSFVGSNSRQRWTWLAITSATRRIGAFVTGRRTDKNCRERRRQYPNAHVQAFASDDWPSYQKYVPTALQHIGKDKTQRIERVNLNFRGQLKRLPRRTIAFSKSAEMHDAVIKLYVHYHHHKLCDTT